MKKQDESWEDYLYRKQCPGTYARLHGVEPFEELFSKGVIVPFITSIRIMYTGCLDTVYVVNEKGRLLDIVRDEIYNNESVGSDAAEVLSARRNPHGWELEGMKPQGYDERNKK